MPLKGSPGFPAHQPALNLSLASFALTLLLVGPTYGWMTGLIVAVLAPLCLFGLFLLGAWLFSRLASREN